jgi:hypothetical protein
MDCRCVFAFYVGDDSVSEIDQALRPVFDKIDPLFWFIPLAMILLPIVAAKRGSKWWWVVKVAAVITLFAVLRFTLHSVR